MPKKRNFDSLNVVFNIQRLFGIKGNTRICVHYLKAFFEILSEIIRHHYLLKVYGLTISKKQRNRHTGNSRLGFTSNRQPWLHTLLLVKMDSCKWFK
jgi:hypothetical protein